MANKCNSCGGTYEPVQRDGSRYSHACSPEIIETPAVFKADGSIKTPEVRVPRGYIRNENLTIDPQTREPVMVSEGLGVTEL